MGKAVKVETSMTRILVIALACLTAFACASEKKPQGLVAEAKLGVFFGGQVQNRNEIPLELDRNKQSQGIVLAFSEPLAQNVTVRWEIDMSSAGRGAGRRTRLGEATAVAGERRFEQGLPFLPGDAPGVWNVRVLVDGELVLDRAIVVGEARK